MKSLNLLTEKEKVSV